MRSMAASNSLIGIVVALIVRLWKKGRRRAERIKQRGAAENARAQLPAVARCPAGTKPLAHVAAGLSRRLRRRAPASVHSRPSAG
jgi:hypothetical protein